MGCGKSTLLNLLSGVTQAGYRRRSTSMAQPLSGIARQASIVFQNYSLLPWFSAVENVRLAVDAAHPQWSRAEQKEQSERYLRLVGLGNAHAPQAEPALRRNAAARRHRPRIRNRSRSAVSRRTVRRARRADARRAFSRSSRASARRPERPVTTVMITNNIDEALLLSDRIIPMTKGPRATLGASVAVDLAKPRSAEQLAHDEQAIRRQGPRRRVPVRSSARVTLAAAIQRARSRRRPFRRSPSKRLAYEHHRSARAHRSHEGVPTPRPGRSSRSRTSTSGFTSPSSSASSGIPAAASRRCCRSSRGFSRRPREGSSSRAGRRSSPAPTAQSSFRRPRCCHGSPRCRMSTLAVRQKFRTLKASERRAHALKYLDLDERRRRRRPAAE